MPNLNELIPDPTRRSSTKRTPNAANGSVDSVLRDLPHSCQGVAQHVGDVGLRSRQERIVTELEQLVLGPLYR